MVLSNKGISDKAEILDDLRRNKRNRSVAEAGSVLAAYGFRDRPARREGTVWSRGTTTLTLPNPHGRGDKSLFPKYVSLIVRKIEEAEALEEGRAESETEGWKDD